MYHVYIPNYGLNFALPDPSKVAIVELLFSDVIHYAIDMRLVITNSYMGISLGIECNRRMLMGTIIMCDTMEFNQINYLIPILGQVISHPKEDAY